MTENEEFRCMSFFSKQTTEKDDSTKSMAVNEDANLHISCIISTQVGCRKLRSLLYESRRNGFGPVLSLNWIIKPCHIP